MSGVDTLKIHQIIPMNLRTLVSPSLFIRPFALGIRPFGIGDSLCRVIPVGSHLLGKTFGCFETSLLDQPYGCFNALPADTTCQQHAKK